MLKLKFVDGLFDDDQDKYVFIGVVERQDTGEVYEVGFQDNTATFYSPANPERQKTYKTNTEELKKLRRLTYHAAMEVNIAEYNNNWD